jgi:cell wall-associated NlpC family hydrolase
MQWNGASYLFLLAFCTAGSTYNCNHPVAVNRAIKMTDSTERAAVLKDTGNITSINTGVTTPAELIRFARTLTGIPYRYNSTDPAVGFDCSGFVTYVFNHFGILVPRSSAEFVAVNPEIPLTQAKAGDVLVFTGTDPKIRTGGHVGIVVSHPGEDVRFIHSTSGKANGVTETTMNAYYMERYIKTIRVFRQNN